MVRKYLVTNAICSSSALILRPLAACYQKPIIRSVQTGCDKHGDKVFGNERAASTAEEFLKIAEEKAEQGISSQTADDEVEEDDMLDASDDVDVAKERLKPGVEEGSFINTPSDNL
ncbi:unnamed protein product [Rhodiola kirilowii]